MEEERKHRHFVIHKPYGYISQFIDPSNKKSKLLGELFDFPEGIMSIGRLDKDSEGLLLLTTNGLVSDKVRSKEIEKEYYVQVDGLVTAESVKMLSKGVEIGVKGEKYKTLACKVHQIPDPQFPLRTKKIRDDRHGPTSWISITISEGKFRQVRKMTATVGLPTLRLIRVRVGVIEIGELKSGDVKEFKDLLSKVY